MPRKNNFFVITGGPGSGKSTLIGALSARGYETTEEVGRRIIQEQQTVGGKALPWADKALFAELMLSWEMRSYRDKMGSRNVVFFDRGVPDVVGYLELEDIPVPCHASRAAQTLLYAPRVFLCPPWPEIFGQDAERKQTLEVAARTYDTMVRTYGALGYELVEVPRATVDERADFVIRMAER
ncbi:ATPase [Agaricicola taiwanensis]|uniref:ATPase n=1 Tax=Agaricicola taiwanensis TaxID=591372 RepID=A0A8J2VKN4_9RHOB|nr:AAA family ATPase [Agaricicola taiwanensis]GGE34463.1 ATPase [Agaricicola taiwanensis]